MDHQDHVYLVKEAISKDDKLWADFGSGDGAFTLAMADITDSKAHIFSIDQDYMRLARQEARFTQMFPDAQVEFIKADFTKPLNLPKLDGIIMANSLHYIKDQVSFLKDIQKYLKPKGKLVLVEYNAETGNYWVPFPISFSKFTTMATEAGFSRPKLLETIPSGFLEEIYSAVTRSK